MIEEPLNGLNAWVSYLSVCDIPMLQYTQIELSRCQSEIDEISIDNISDILYHDALAILRLSRHAQHITPRHLQNEVTTVSKCLMISGLLPSIRILTKSTSLDQHYLKNSFSTTHANELLQRAYLAGSCAQALADRRNDIDSHEVRTAAVLHDVAELLIACYAPKVLHRVHELQTNDRMLRSKVAQKRVFGITFQELEMALIEEWRLPRILQQLIDSSNEANPRVRTVRWATNAARHLSTAWNDAALPDDYKEGADIANISPESCADMTRHTALQTAKDWRWYNVRPPASTLLQYPA
ncbi:HDOD domain-containing protein [Burkholderiaceae bacterium DAT-1]|nr:HDOD domain-containing protein [Burkholderiaceae bacterium DAT-1]